MEPMTRFGMLYIMVIAGATSFGFFAGRWSAPEHQKLVQVQAPIFQAPVEPIPAPPPATAKTAEPVVQPVAPVVAAPVTTVDQLPVYSGTASTPPVGTIGDDLLPIKKPAPPMVSASVAAHPVAAPVVTPVVTPVKAAPEPIVLEEIPDNPYKHK